MSCGIVCACSVCAIGSVILVLVQQVANLCLRSRAGKKLVSEDHRAAYETLPVAESVRQPDAPIDKRRRT